MFLQILDQRIAVFRVLEAGKHHFGAGHEFWPGLVQFVVPAPCGEAAEGKTITEKSSSSHARPHSLAPLEEGIIDLPAGAQVCQISLAGTDPDLVHVS